MKKIILAVAMAMFAVVGAANTATAATSYNPASPVQGLDWVISIDDSAGSETCSTAISEYEFDFNQGSDVSGGDIVGHIGETIVITVAVPAEATSVTYSIMGSVGCGGAGGGVFESATVDVLPNTAPYAALSCNSEESIGKIVVDFSLTNMTSNSDTAKLEYKLNSAADYTELLTGLEDAADQQQEVAASVGVNDFYYVRLVLESDDSVMAEVICSNEAPNPSGELVCGNVVSGNLEIDYTFESLDVNSETVNFYYQYGLLGTQIAGSTDAGNSGTTLVPSSDDAPNYRITAKGANSGFEIATVVCEGTNAIETVDKDEELTGQLFIEDGDKLAIDGSAEDVYVYEGGKLYGTGEITGVLFIFEGATLSPGASPGCLSSGNLSLSGTFEVELEGSTVCTEYDQQQVTGSVTLNDPTLDLVFLNGFEPGEDDEFVIISNDGSDAVSGTFDGLAEGDQIELSGVVLSISYEGGDGNDVVLSTVPTLADTGVDTNTALNIAAGTVLVMITIVATDLGQKRKIKQL